MERVEILNFAYESVYFADWRDAISDVFSGRAEIIEEYETIRIGTMEGNQLGSIAMPKTVRFKSGIPSSKFYAARQRPKFSRSDLFLRDNGVCQYCEKRLCKEVATIDHVVPRSKGGLTTWENCVICCADCNSKKGNKSLSETSMKLIKVPAVPKPGSIPMRRK